MPVTPDQCESLVPVGQEITLQGFGVDDILLRPIQHIQKNKPGCKRLGYNGSAANLEPCTAISAEKCHLLFENSS